MKTASNFILSLILCFVVGSLVSSVLPIDQSMATLACVGASVGMSFVKLPAGALHVVVLRQMWETALVDHFRAMGNFLMGVPRKDQYVGNNVINITEIGADPDVLINNTTYPIATAQRTDDNIAIALNKYDTTNTKITDDELYALPYDKEGSVVAQHRAKLDEDITAHALHSLCVAGNSGTTPVLETTGADDGTGRKRMVPADLIRLQLALDNLKVPAAGRRLVLAPVHCSDLLLADLSFAQPFHNAKDGLILPNYYGFETFKYVNAPVFNTAGAKKAFGAAGASGDRQASVVFLVGKSFTAMGSLKFYYSAAETDPQNRESSAGYRLWSVTLPMKNTGFGAMISANV
jgi:hypothetical protein